MTFDRKPGGDRGLGAYCLYEFDKDLAPRVIIVDARYGYHAPVE